MKTKTPAATDKSREVRPDYRQAIYSQGASDIMDRIMGTHTPKPTVAPKPPAAATAE